MSALFVLPALVSLILVIRGQMCIRDRGYMSIANASPEFLAKNPQLASKIQDSSYDSPFHFAEGANRVLVIGSGAGKMCIRDRNS